MKIPALKSDIRYIKGIGPVKGKAFEKLNVKTIDELLRFFPKKWEDRGLEGGEGGKTFDFIEKPAVFLGEVISASQAYTASSLVVFNAVLKNGNKKVKAEFFKKFNRRFDVLAKLKKDFIIGEKIWIVGKDAGDFLERRIRVSEYYKYGDYAVSHCGALIPIYQLSEGLSSPFIRDSVRAALDEYAEKEREFIPETLLKKRGLYTPFSALKNIHFPKSAEILLKAKERFVYEEFLLMLCAWHIKRKTASVSNKNRIYEIKKNLLTPFKQNLGFEFTNAQKKAINEIFADMNRPVPMSRLLQGDVGSGKTVVALSACLLAVENGFQCCFMAPTEILAQQHFFSLNKFLKGLPVKAEFISSSVSRAQKEMLSKRAKDGDIDIFIGTHSLIEKDITFKNLALAIVDEQHRFGVRQRAALRLKGENTDMLIMTATPIPRTLAISLYGDLDLSGINELPPGRKPVKTAHSSQNEAFAQMKKQLSLGRQGYMVYPVIEDSDSDLKSLKKEFETHKDYFSPFRCAILHGKMKPKEKLEIMEDFKNGKISVLFATQVIEVGIDAPNASVMIIQSAERFGMASLHQLRGRVGRSGYESFCFLVSGRSSVEANERIKEICFTNDGFKLSQKDAYMRGVGELMGFRQHGDLEFKIASVYEDKEILEKCLEDKEELFLNDENLSTEENLPLREKILDIYGGKWGLIDIS